MMRGVNEMMLSPFVRGQLAEERIRLELAWVVTNTFEQVLTLVDGGFFVATTGWHYGARSLEAFSHAPSLEHSSLHQQRGEKMDVPRRFEWESLHRHSHDVGK